ncbi:MAG: M50 family metallopeptidase [Pyrinomonadaceae bacterium MAG19_C2-C3]|nr:M50 family metallopeptidase [Pyrinomonadaceae bacterium MAG19_C2-C3]
MKLKYKLAQDARPQVATLLIATLITVALWFIPFADVLTYPFRLFVTFIHEGGHALATVLTGNSVQSLTIHANGSGEVLSSIGGTFSGMLISSAGYLGATAFGALLLVLIRRTFAARAVLIASAGFILVLTLAYGIFGSIFTVVSGVTIALALLLTAKFAGARVASFLVSFLAVQCVLNALTDLKTVFFLSSPFAPEVHTDAMNMAMATGIPSMFWAILWVGGALVILALALRAYATTRTSPMQTELPFEDPIDENTNDFTARPM